MLLVTGPSTGTYHVYPSPPYRLVRAGKSVHACALLPKRADV